MPSNFVHSAAFNPASGRPLGSAREGARRAASAHSDLPMESTCNTSKKLRPPRLAEISCAAGPIACRSASAIGCKVGRGNFALPALHSCIGTTAPSKGRNRMRAKVMGRGGRNIFSRGRAASMMGSRRARDGTASSTATTCCKTESEARDVRSEMRESASSPLGVLCGPCVRERADCTK